MKKLALICCLSISALNSLYGAVKIPCDSQVMSGQMNVVNSMQNVYSQLISKLESELVQAYDNYKQAIEKQNKLLQDVQTLKERNALLEKQILFLREQDKELAGILIDSVNAKKELKNR